MAETNVQELYERHVKSLPVSERLQLIELTARDLVAIESSKQTTHHARSITELHGLGKEIWEGIDPQEYVNDLRKDRNDHT